METKEQNKDSDQPHVILDEDNLSDLSVSSFDSIDNIKFEKMGQYTCDECGSIPKIINLDEKTKTITFKCETHGLKTMSLNSYLFSCLNYNSKNWKCSACQTIQRNSKGNFKYCECGNVFCEECYNSHNRKEGHKYNIESDKFDLRCKKSKEHFSETFKGFCYECRAHFCQKCENEHKWHEVVNINNMQMKKEEIEKIDELNKEYKKLIAFYKSLIRLNELIIYSYDNYKNNYYNLNNINTIINNSKRNNIIDTLNGGQNRVLMPGENNSNQFNFMNELYKTDITEEKEGIEMNNKFLNNYDLKMLTLMPLENLRLLNLENNSISEIDCLKDCSFINLVILNLNNNAIKDISIFEKTRFDNIQALFLRNNSIKDISVFGKRKFADLRQLDLRNNCIEDIKAFDTQKEKLPNLLGLYLTNNSFDKKKFEATIKIIEGLVEKEY